MPILTAGLVRAVCEGVNLLSPLLGRDPAHGQPMEVCHRKTEDSNEVAVNIALLKTPREFRARYGYDLRPSRFIDQ
jgi:hypothetical protein